MKRKLLILVSVLLLLSGFFWFLTTMWGIEKEIRISTPIYKVAEQFTNLKNWKNWNPDLLNIHKPAFIYSDSISSVHSFLRIGDQQYTIVKISPASIIVKEEVSGRKAYHSLTAFPDSFGMATKVHWTESLSLIDWLKRRKETATQMETGLKNLKQFLEDPIKQYGFRIELKSVTDTLILIKEMTTALRNRFPSLQNAYQDIREFAKQNDINITGREMANFHQIGDDSIQIMAGIPVSKKGTAKNGFAFLEMPNHGKMLVGYYDGPYSGLQKLYQAMEKYINEKNLKKISSEYEKYINNPVSVRDSSHVSLELHYPVL